MSAPAIISSGTAAGGPPVGGTGTPNTIPRWTGPSTLGDSGLIDNGTAIYTTARDRFGIGIATPDQGLHVLSPNNATTSGGQVTQQNFNGVSNQKWMTSVGGGDNVWVNGRGWFLRDMTAGATRIVCDTSGNVGIGAPSPGDRLQIGAPTGTAPFGIIIGENYGAASQRARLAFGDANRGIGLTSGDNVLIHTFNTNSILFGHGSTTSFTERARIDSAGRLLVGTTSTPSSAAVRVVVAAASGGQQWHSQGLGGCAVVASVNTAQWYVYPGANVGSEGYLSSVKLTETGLDVTTASATPGIKLPATPGNSDTQTLDCYAEGTWTPTLAGFGGTNPTVTASYTRVGRLVTIAVQIDATGGNQYSMTLGTTTITTPAGMTASSICAVPVVDGGVANRGIASVWTTGIIYLPTVALTTASTFFVATYRV